MVQPIIMQGSPFRLKCSECLSYGLAMCGGGGSYGRVYPPSIWGVWRLSGGPKKCLSAFWATRERIMATRIAPLFCHMFVFIKLKCWWTNMMKKQNIFLWAGREKKLEFLLACLLGKQVAHFACILLVLINVFVRGWLGWTLFHWASKL